MTGLEHGFSHAGNGIQPSQGILTSIVRDPIATLRSLIRAVSFFVE
jgi:hypothetical protein